MPLLTILLWTLLFKYYCAEGNGDPVGSKTGPSKATEETMQCNINHFRLYMTIVCTQRGNQWWGGTPLWHNYRQFAGGHQIFIRLASPHQHAFTKANLTRLLQKSIFPSVFGIFFFFSPAAGSIVKRRYKRFATRLKGVIWYLWRRYCRICLIANREV